MATKKTKTLELWLPIAISVGLTVIGAIANYATLQTRLNDLDAREAKLEARYEREIVPRTEIESADKAQELRLERMENSLEKMRTTLDEILSNLPHNKRG